MLRNFGSNLAIGLLISATAWAEPPRINGTIPFGVPRGVPTEVAIQGANLGGNPRLIAPFPFTAEPVPAPNMDPANGKLKVVVAPNCPVGVFPIRVQTDEGISNPLLFSVGQVPQVGESEENNSFESARAIPPLVVVEGQLPGNDVDYFRFPGKRGQRIVVDAQCARIGSGVDPTIRLTTAARSFVASAEDTPGLMTDARLTALLPEDGDYVVEISDSRYQGGGRPIYRLLVGPVPVADEVFPLGGRRGEVLGVELRGGTLPDLKIAATLLNPAHGSNVTPLLATNQGLGLAGPTEPILNVETIAPLAVGDLPELREPADPAAPPLRALAPLTINGRIDPAGDVDRFALVVTPGQAYRIRVDASPLGSALDGQLQVLGAGDAVLASADDATLPPAAPGLTGLIVPDPSIDFTVPGGLAEITLVLRDLESRGGVGFPYRLTVEAIAPNFKVALSEAEVNIPKAGTAVVAATLTRQGYNGPITLSVANSPPGMTVRPGLIAEGQTVGTFSLSAAPDASFGAIDLQILAEGKGTAGPIAVTAEKVLVLAQQGMVPTSILTQTGLAAAPRLPGSLSLDAPASIEVVRGFGASIPIKVARAPGADGALTISPLPLPAGLAVPAATIAEKAPEGSATVNAAFPEATLGTMTIALIAKGKFGDKELTFGVPAITLTVVRPASLELATTGLEVKAGAAVEVKGKVVRKAPFNGPVTVRIDGLPAGLKADPVPLAPEASDFALKVIADPDAAAASANANVVLTLQINGKDDPAPPIPLLVKVLPK